MDAYRTVTEYFYLRAKQRDMLDVCERYEDIMAAGRDEDMIKARDLLIEAGILFF